MRLPLPTIAALAGLPLLLLGADAPVRAENGCPYGYTPWRVPILSLSDCAPIVDDAPARRPAEPVWATRWGAVAIGDTTKGGGVGTSVDRKSRREAENAAIKTCESTAGGSDCRADVFSYHNQCVALSWGFSTYVLFTAATLDQAADGATRRCTARNEGCRLYYSACSYPVRIR